MTKIIAEKGDESMQQKEQKIIEVYRATESIKHTSKVIGVSEPTVRRILILAGEYTNSTAKSISRLHEAGKTAAEISEILHLSKSTVWAYLPYYRTPYISENKTKNAIRIKACRERKNRNK